MTRVVPAQPIDLDEVRRRWPTVRQSLLSSFDDCALSAYFELEHTNGWSTHPQALGTLFHRYVAEVLREMQRQGHNTIPVTVARAILLEVCEQRGVSEEEIVRVPIRMMPELRTLAEKFARDNRFTIEKLVDVEKRLEADIEYRTDQGELVKRTLTGQIDALLVEPPAAAVVLDWKSSWALPLEPREKEAEERYEDDELRGLSYHGYFQQRFYGWLVMRTYRNVDRVTLREFYARKTKVRKATLHRHQLEDVEDELRVLVEAFDRAIMQGSPAKILRGDEEGYVDFDALGFWRPSPGRHCGFCCRPTACPIEEEVRAAAGGAASSPEEAAVWAARLQKAERIREVAREACKGWVETAGSPIPVKWAKGRRLLGWYETRRGRRFGFFTPSASDRGAHPDAAFDEELKAAMRESTRRARAERKKVER